MDVEELRRLIMEKTGMSRKDLDSLVEKRIKEFAGLLTELGALYTIAKENGIDVDVGRDLGARKKIADLKPGERGVWVIGRVIATIPPREVKKDGRTIRYASVILYDGSGEIRLVLWGKDVDLVNSGRIRHGSIVEVVNGSVEEFNGRLSLKIPYDGRLVIDPPLEEEIPEMPAQRVSDLKVGSTTNVILRVKRSFPVKTTMFKGEEIKYGGFIGEDDTGSIRVVLWRDNATDIPEGSLVRVFGYVKEGRNGLEIHVGGSGSVEVIEEAEDKLVFLDEVSNGVSGTVIGTIVRIYSRRPYAGKCNVCGGDVEWREGKFVCKECGSEDVSVTPILAVEIDDGYGSAKAVFFDDVAKEIYGEDYPSDVSIERARDLIGRTVMVKGTFRTNNVTGRLDLVVRTIHRDSFYDIFGILVDEVAKRLEESPEKGSEED